MPQEIQQKHKRVRAFKPKVITGCITCKIRRIKCDEVKPYCNRCTSTGRKCDGYAAKSPSRCGDCRGSSINSSSGLGSVSGIPDEQNVEVGFHVSTPRSIGDELIGTAKERRYFYFFQNRVTGRIAGQFNSQFWSRSVLQAAHHEPAILHAVIALGSLYEVFESGDTINRENMPDGFATQQYIKAIGCLVEPIVKKGQQATDVALMTCILFICFEILRGHQGAALCHINSGTKIISELQANARGTTQSSIPAYKVSAYPYVPLNELTNLMKRLDMQATQMMGRRPLVLDNSNIDGNSCSTNNNIMPHLQPIITLSFSSLEEARTSLEYLWTAITKTLYSAFEQHAAERCATWPQINTAYQNALISWSHTLDVHLATRSSALTKPEFQASHLLRLQQKTLLLSIQTASNGAAYPYLGNLGQQMEEMVEHAELAVDIPEVTGPQCAPYTFSLDTGILVPLYFVTSRSQDPALRRRTIALCKASRRQEGMWNSDNVAKVLSRLVDIEEKGTNGDKAVLGLAKTDVEVQFSEDGKGTLLRYLKQVTRCDAGKEIFRERI